MSARKRRVLIICQHFWPENFRVNDIAEYFASEKNCEIEVLCGLPNYPSGKIYAGYSAFKNRKQIHNSIHIQRVLEIPRGNNSNIRIFLNYVSFPFFSLFHIPRLLTKNYDQIFLYQLSPVIMSFVGIVLGKLKKIPTTMYVLDLWPENLYSVINFKNRLLRKFIQTLSNWHYKKADKLIALSDSMKHRLVEVTGKDDASIVVLPQAIENIYKKIPDNPQLKYTYSKTFNVVYTGNISPAQSFETIIQSANILISKGLKDIRWIIVGDGMSRKKIESLVDDAHLTHYFVFEGQKSIEEIPTYLDVADCVIGTLTKSPLLEATIPAKVMSYIASGKPMVLAMDGEVQELINQKIQCGFAGPAGDENLLAKNILRIYSMSQKERVEMGRRGKEYHQNHFDREVLLNRMYDFIFTSDTV